MRYQKKYRSLVQIHEKISRLMTVDSFACNARFIQTTKQVIWNIFRGISSSRRNLDIYYLQLMN